MARPRSAITEKILAESNSILEAQAPMTLRHLFYILVSRGFVESNLDNELWATVRAEEEDELAEYRKLIETFKNNR